MNMSEESEIAFKILTETSIKINNWDHVQRVFANSEYLLNVIKESRYFLQDSQHNHLLDMKNAINQLKLSIERNGPWENTKIREIETYWEYAKIVDKRLFKISLPLLLVIQDKMQLITWLRSIRDDEVFATSIEMSRSLQEMNTPIELWDSLSGRVNERFLSMISNVRGYLHAYLYDVDPHIISIETYLSIFGGFNEKTSPDRIIDNIRACHDVWKPLKQIIGVKRDMSGASRLIHLYSKECDSFWSCSKSSSNEDSILFLKYKVCKLQYFY
jgi:hypothetical protein